MLALPGFRSQCVGLISIDMGACMPSGMIEAFSSGVAITALVDPTVDAGGLPAARRSRFVNTAGVRCSVSSYQLSLNASTALNTNA